MVVTAFQSSVVWFSSYRNMTLCVYINWVWFPVRAKIFMLCTVSRPPLGLTIPTSSVTAVFFPVIRSSVVTTCVSAALWSCACCSAAQWQLYVAAPVAVLVTDRNSYMIWDTRQSGCGSSSIRFVFVFWGHQRKRYWYTAFIIALVSSASCTWKGNLFSTVILNTLRTGDAVLRFYITTVQDGWRKSAFLTRACFPCTIHLIMQYIEPVSEGSCWRMFIETWPHSELTFRHRASSI